MKKITILFYCICSLSLYSQDNCASAIAALAGLNNVGTVNGTQAPSPLCIGSSGTNTLFAEWYTYTPSQNYSVTITSDIAENTPRKDTRVHVYTGNCGSLTCVAGNDDGGSNYSSVVNFSANAGTTYYIAWDSRWSTQSFVFKLIENVLVPPPCLTATPISAGLHTVSTIDDANGNNITCSTGSLAEWYSFTPTQTKLVTVTSDLPENSCKNTFLSILTGACPTLTCFQSDDNSGTVTCSSDGTSNLSTLSFIANAGTTYYIAWDNRWSNQGFNFKIIEENIPISYTVTTLPLSLTASNQCVVDMNNDSKDDIVIVNNNKLNILYQDSLGAINTTPFDLTLPTGTRMPSWSIAAGDYNKDDYNDLILGNSGGLSVLRSENNGTNYTAITPSDYIFCQRTNFTDINNDGNLDLFSCHDIAPNVYYLNNGTGTLTYYQSGVTSGSYLTGTSGGNYASLWTDYDNDGDSDLFISKCSGPPCELIRNDGNGVFTNITAQAQLNFTPVDSWSSAVADFDNDGDMDILVGSNGSVGSRLFRNDLNTTNNVEEPFTNITASSGFDNLTNVYRDYIAYDFDNDGWIDIMGSNSKIMFNKGNNNFSPINYSTNLTMGGIGDLNNDGFLDSFYGNKIYYAVPNTNKWIRINLKGVQSNRNGIGARVEINGSWGKQIRDVRSGEGFAHMSTLGVHFGIGQANMITSIIIRWPSGLVDAYYNVSPNQSLTYIEGAALSTNDFSNDIFSISPNPAKEFINISHPESVSINDVKVYDLTGRMVIENNNNNYINISNLANGTFLIVIKDNDGKTYFKKFIKA